MCKYPYMKTNVDYWHNSHGVVGEVVRVNGNASESHLSSHATLMEIDKDVKLQPY